MTRTRAWSVTGTMSPKPTDEKTVTVKYRESVRFSVSEKDAGLPCALAK